MLRRVASTLTWSRYDEEIGSIQVLGGEESITLNFKYAGEEDVSQRVKLTHTSCNFGGTRPWFVCPNCTTRVGTLLGGRRFACRRCYGVVYQSQQCGKLERLMNRMHKQERRLERPGLHQKTKDRISKNIYQLDDQIGTMFFLQFGWRI